MDEVRQLQKKKEEIRMKVEQVVREALALAVVKLIETPFFAPGLPFEISLGESIRVERDAQGRTVFSVALIDEVLDRVARGVNETSRLRGRDVLLRRDC